MENNTHTTPAPPMRTDLIVEQQSTAGGIADTISAIAQLDHFQLVTILIGFILIIILIAIGAPRLIYQWRTAGDRRKPNGTEKHIDQKIGELKKELQEQINRRFEGLATEMRRQEKKSETRDADITRQLHELANLVHYAIGTSRPHQPPAAPPAAPPVIPAPPADPPQK